jgi:biotin carboxyl carrier protein
MLKVIVNKDKIFEYVEQGKITLLNGESEQADIARLKEDTFNILLDNKSIEIELVEQDPTEKRFLFKIKNQKFEINIQDETDLVLERLGLNNVRKSILNEIKAPMPGLIIDVLVEEGSKVEKGTSLVILEAMKMENIIKSPGEGVIKKILVKKGDTVEKNHILLHF